MLVDPAYLVKRVRAYIDQRDLPVLEQNREYVVWLAYSVRA